MIHLGDFPTGATVRLPWNTNAADGSSVTRATDGSIRIYKDSSLTQRSSSAGITDSEDYDGITGVHLLTIDLADNTDAGFYAAGHDYQVLLVAATIDGQTVNAWLGAFSIQNRYYPTAPTAASIRAEIDSNSTQLAAIAGYVDTEVAAIKAKTDLLPAGFPANFATLSIDANGRVKAQVAVQKNVAFTNFLFQMTDATTHAPKTGLVNGDFTKQETIDGAAGAALSGTITEVDAGDLPGFYKIDFTAGELNGNAIGLRFAASGCDDTELTILTNA